MKKFGLLVLISMCFGLSLVADLTAEDKIIKAVEKVAIPAYNNSSQKYLHYKDKIDEFLILQENEKQNIIDSVIAMDKLGIKYDHKYLPSFDGNNTNLISIKINPKFVKKQNQKNHDLKSFLNRRVIEMFYSKKDNSVFIYKKGNKISFVLEEKLNPKYIGKKGTTFAGVDKNTGLVKFSKPKNK